MEPHSWGGANHWRNHNHGPETATAPPPFGQGAATFGPMRRRSGDDRRQGTLRTYPLQPVFQAFSRDKHVFPQWCCTADRFRYRLPRYHRDHFTRPHRASAVHAPPLVHRGCPSSRRSTQNMETQNTKPATSLRQQRACASLPMAARVLTPRQRPAHGTRTRTDRNKGTIHPHPNTGQGKSKHKDLAT